MADHSMGTVRRAVCYVCPICCGRITRVTFKGNSAFLQWRCRQCAKPFGPAWRKADWGTTPGVCLVGPELLPPSGLRRLGSAVLSLINQLVFLAVLVVGNML